MLPISKQKSLPYHFPCNRSVIAGKARQSSARRAVCGGAQRTDAPYPLSLGNASVAAENRTSEVLSFSLALYVYHIIYIRHAAVKIRRLNPPPKLLAPTRK